MLSTTDVTPSHHEFSDVDMPDRDTTGLDFDSDEGKRLLRKLDWRLVVGPRHARQVIKTSAERPPHSPCVGYYISWDTWIGPTSGTL